MNPTWMNIDFHNACMDFTDTWLMIVSMGNKDLCACIGGKGPCVALGANAHLRDHDHDTYGRLW